VTEISRFLAMLQYGDSFFPTGSVSFSWGLEGLMESGAVSGASDVECFLLGQIRSRWAAYDRPALAAAHGAKGDIDAITAVDAEVELTTLSSELRNASCRMGAAMLSVFQRLGDAPASAFRARIAAGAAHGHLPVVQGCLWQGAGLSLDDVLALSAHTFSTGLLGAAVRLGCITHIDAQRLLGAARREAALISETPPVPLHAMNAFAMEVEIAVMRHLNRDQRLFAN